MDYYLNVDYCQTSTAGIKYNAVLGIEFSAEGSDPVTELEAAEWCRIDIVENATLLQNLITTARMQCEAYVNMSFIQRHVKARLRNELGGIWLPYSPVRGTVPDGVQFDKLETITQDTTIEYDAGYDVLPIGFKISILQQVAYLYDHRGDENEGKLSPMVMAGLRPHRRT